MFPFKGILNSILRGRKRSVSETLEDLDLNIELLKEHKESKVLSANKIAFHLIFYATVLYVTVLVVSYFIIRPSATHGKILFVVFAIFYPFVVWMLKYVINLFYLGSADRADKKLKALMKQKRKILEDVMNTETYNRAQQILKRFDPLGLVIREERPTPSRPFFKREIETNTRIRPVSANLNFQNGPSQMQEPRELTTQTPQILGPLSTIEATTMQPSKGPITHRPILPRKRSIFDVVVDALVGDGPDRRYALICHQCAGHNGMALAEEFEYLAFRCCYCGFHNPARRIRRNPPPVPRLQTFPSPGSRSSIGTPLSGCARGFSASAANLSVTGPTPPSPINKSSSTENVFLGTPVLSKVAEVSGLFSVESEESENLSLPSGSPTGVHASKQQTKRTRKLD